MDHGSLGRSLKMFCRLGCPWPLLGQMVPRPCMCKEVKGNRELILMNREKGSLCTQAAEGFHIESDGFWREGGQKEAGTAGQAQERGLLNMWESLVAC